MNSITPFLAWYEIPPFTVPKDKEEYEQRKKAFLSTELKK